MIYVLQPEVGGPVKIGYSKDRNGVYVRAATLEPGCPWPLKVVYMAEGGKWDEGRLHARFQQYRIHREWFALEGGLLLWLNGLSDKAGPTWPTPDHGEAEVIELGAAR